MEPAIGSCIVKVEYAGQVSREIVPGGQFLALIVDVGAAGEIRLIANEPFRRIKELGPLGGRGSVAIYLTVIIPSARSNKGGK